MSSMLRAALRSRLSTAMRERDRDAVSVLRCAVAAIENAEAVTVDEGHSPTTSADVAGAAVGLGVTDRDRGRLDADAERAVVKAEVAALLEAEIAYAAAGDLGRARSAAAGGALLGTVLAEVHAVSG